MHELTGPDRKPKGISPTAGLCSIRRRHRTSRLEALTDFWRPLTEERVHPRDPRRSANHDPGYDDSTTSKGHPNVSIAVIRGPHRHNERVIEDLVTRNHVLFGVTVGVVLGAPKVRTLSTNFADNFVVVGHGISLLAPFEQQRRRSKPELLTVRGGTSYGRLGPRRLVREMAPKQRAGSQSRHGN